MGGKIFQCNSKDKSMKQLIDLKSTITCIRVYHYKHLDYPLLSAGTTGGNLYTFKIEGDKITMINQFIAHLPQPDNTDLRFGSLKLKAEIWSLTSHPETLLNKKENHYVITSSEDQTIKVWEFTSQFDNKPVLLNSFKHHDLAVTCVDWKKMNCLSGEVLASCSDDMTIQIYDPVDGFKKIQALSTKEIVLDWHTITYMSLEEVFYIFMYREELISHVLLRMVMWLYSH